MSARQSAPLAKGNFRHYTIFVRVTFDPAKRASTLERRGLDFADAARVFAEPHATFADDRRDYGEQRFITAGRLDGRFVMLVWTPRGSARRIISMRYGHASEEQKWRQRLG
jgi:uncharacterized DUF497 family protein